MYYEAAVNASLIIGSILLRFPQLKYYVGVLLKPILYFLGP